MKQEQAIVLFYKYFSPSSPSSPSHRAIEKWWDDPKGNVQKLYLWHESMLSSSLSSLELSPLSEKKIQQPRNRKQHLSLVGRILISIEGINGTLSGSCKDIETYIELMKEYHCLSMSSPTSDSNYEEKNDRNRSNDDDDIRIFQNVDWKMSYDSSTKKLFPDLKISIVKEIVSTSGLVDVNDIPLETGNHLTPEEFHEILESSSSSSMVQSHQQIRKKEVVLIDVRNTFEHDIGYFIDPKTNRKAIDPKTTTFSSFDFFCDQNANKLRHKKVLMYCTGGIRCEKASVLLKRKGVDDVNQLSGGIHRYLEKYGNNGHFKGLNFTFDKRVAMKPNFAKKKVSESDDCNCNEEVDSAADDYKNIVTISDDNNDNDESYEIVGRCVECNDPFDELCGSRVCTVCTVLVLVCERCRARSNNELREFHCKRHAAWKTCYFSFLDIFHQSELEEQRRTLCVLRDEASVERGNNKNIRRTLVRQITKIESRICEIEQGHLVVDPNAPRRCRSCQEPFGTVCDGNCWGFWKKEITSIADDNSGKGKVVENVNLRGRRAKQKHEAEMEFLTKTTGMSSR